MTIKAIEARFTSGNDIPVQKAMVPADEWKAAVAEISAAVQAERSRCFNVVMDLPLLGGDGPFPLRHWNACSKSFAFEASRLIRDPALDAAWRSSKPPLAVKGMAR